MELREKHGGMSAINGSGHGGNFFARGSRSTWDEIEKQPYFLPTTTVVTVQEGGHAFFICKVENLYNQTVSNNNKIIFLEYCVENFELDLDLVRFDKCNLVIELNFEK